MLTQLLIPFLKLNVSLTLLQIVFMIKTQYFFLWEMGLIIRLEIPMDMLYIKKLILEIMFIIIKTYSVMKKVMVQH
jgi:hypothetical protein